ncbi:hypothetical protein GCM10008959_12240 [Deinococcus seoulensis]|uniref:Uncharacterized protein n=1 Tax=Deinococcus seoulensis TaxID=1837379 RepID=A0ABQ2RNI3_9DEIO|nr:hypothetical protein GCM10008959_12240 [Deinococcus seoulensis]
MLAVHVLDLHVLAFLRQASLEILSDTVGDFSGLVLSHERSLIREHGRQMTIRFRRALPELERVVMKCRAAQPGANTHEGGARKQSGAAGACADG